MAKKKIDSNVPKGFPTNMRLCGQNWEVVYTNQVDKEEHLLGACEGHRRRIYVDTDQDRESMRDTLVHEYMHAVFRMNGVELTEEVEELFAVQATTGFFSLIRDNTAFWEED